MGSRKLQATRSTFVLLALLNVFVLVWKTSILVQESLRSELEIRPVGVADNVVEVDGRRSFHSIERDLETSTTSFYLYDDPIMKQNQTKHVVKKMVWKRYRDEIVYDLKALATIQTSPLRSMSPNNADIYIAPIPVGQILASKTLRIQDAIKALINHDIFKRTHGNNHLIVSSTFVTFRRETILSVKSLAQYYGKLRNVTIASSQDEVLSMEACRHAQAFVGSYEFYGEESGKICDWEANSQQTVVDRFASVGLGDASEDFPIVEATLTNFQTAKTFIFYRTRKDDEFVNNSTVFRNRIIENADVADFPDSVIGFSEPDRQKWLKEYTSSQFCLVLRGDTPNSHALFRSVRAGCIPVIVSDTYPIYVSLACSTYFLLKAISTL